MFEIINKKKIIGARNYYIDYPRGHLVSLFVGYHESRSTWPSFGLGPVSFKYTQIFQINENKLSIQLYLRPS